jgi:hypothetical protein
MSSLSELLPYRGAATERLLLREFSHRVKDELASAISLVAVAAGRCDSGEARAVLVAVLDRLQSHALVHRFFGILFAVNYRLDSATVGSMVIASSSFSIATMAIAIAVLFSH